MKILQELFGDLKHGATTLRRQPRFAVFVIATLALGIGINTAVFSLVDAVILQPLPFSAPDRLLHLETFVKTAAEPSQPVSPADFLDWRERATSFSGIAAYLTETADAILTGTERPAAVKLTLATAELFDVLGVQPELGRGFLPEENWDEAPPAVVLSHALWRGRLGSDPQVLGRHLQLDGSDFVVVGVMPAGFSFPHAATDVWVTPRWRPAFRTMGWFRQARFLHVVARLTPDASVESARSELATLTGQIEKEHPETNQDTRAAAVPLASWLVRDVEQRLFLLWSVVGLVLLIACVNVANMLGARVVARHQELALRRTLGAGRGRLVRLLLGETLPLALAGALLGLVLGGWCLSLVKTASPERWPRLAEASLDLEALGFTLAITLAATLLAGLLPAWIGARAELGSALREAGPRLASARRGLAWGRWLVIGQAALALALVFGAGLLLKSFYRLSHVDPGFDARNVLTVQISLPYGSYSQPEQIQGLFARLEEQVEALSGVQAVSTVSRVPLAQGDWTQTLSWSQLVVDRPGGESEPFKASQLEVGDGFFETMGLPLLAGRGFGSAEKEGGLRSVVLNQTLANALFPGQPALGQRIGFGSSTQPPSEWLEVIGVVADHRQTRLAAPPEPELYRPLSQETRPRQDLVIRSALAPATLAPAVEKILQSIDPNLPLMRTLTLEAAVASALARDRFLTALMLAFGSLGLLLAGLGIYGVTSFSVSLRTAEIGTRMALGADRGEITRQFIKEGARLAAIGLVLGVPAAWLLGRWIGPLLYEVAPLEPAMLAVLAALVVATGAGAACLPARRAAGIDPAATVRGS